MTSLDKAIVAKIKKGGESFEILVDPDLALLYRLGQKKDLNNILVVEEVYKDAKKGERHKSADIKKFFGTEDIFEITKLILTEGEISLTTEQKRKLIEQKRDQIISLIAQQAIDPRTGAPHTILRITQAVEQAKVNIDPLKDAAEQVPVVLDAIKLILPIKLMKRKIAIKISPEYAKKIYGFLKNYGIEKEEWTSSGDFICVISVPAGLAGEFYEKLNKLTAGSAQTKVLE
ncbi:MAG: ribosome assembly factor SBDS [Candidatus Anstonellaceae archaeon]